MNFKKYFKIFTNCIVVKGFNRSLILDIQRGNYTAIPNTMTDVIMLFQNKKSIEDVNEIYGLDNLDVIQEYLDFFIEHEFGFIVDRDEFDLFLDMDKRFEIASKISNCIVELSAITMGNIEKILYELDCFNCKNVQFISYDTFDLEKFILLLNKTNNTNFRSIEFILKYSDTIFNFIDKIKSNNQKITSLTLHSSEEKDKKTKGQLFDVLFIDYELKNFKNCGVIDTKYFGGVNKYKVLESINHNSCLNKKISIDKNGDIRNCPAMPDSFGNIKVVSLEKALHSLNFKKYWNITKDQIHVCKDCEFRHNCTDCRAFLEDPNNEFSKPLKCGYNPYKNTWEDWSTNPLKQNAINFYGIQELKKNAAH